MSKRTRDELHMARCEALAEQLGVSADKIDDAMDHLGIEFIMQGAFEAATKKLKDLVDGVQELATQVAPDYPDIEHCKPWEHFWAIRASYEGTCNANKDLHRLCGHLQKKLGMDVHDVIAKWDELRKETGNPYE